MKASGKTSGTQSMAPNSEAVNAKWRVGVEPNDPSRTLSHNAARAETRRCRSISMDDEGGTARPTRTQDGKETAGGKGRRGVGAGAGL